MKKQTSFLLIATFVIFACGSFPAAQTSTPTAIPFTEIPSLTFTLLFTDTPTITLTPTMTDTPTITPTPTFAFPTVTVNKQAHCRYGPSAAFLHAADLYPGDTGTVRGRFEYSSWLFIKFDKLKYYCWVAPSVVDVVGDINTINFTDMNLDAVPYDVNGPPKNVIAVRNGDEVTISWDQVHMTTDHDRGYLIIAFVCQNGAYLWWTFSYPDQFTTSYTVKDEAGCALPSEGKIYTIDKEGISKPGDIPWPP